MKNYVRTTLTLCLSLLTATIGLAMRDPSVVASAIVIIAVAIVRM